MKPLVLVGGGTEEDSEGFLGFDEVPSRQSLTWTEASYTPLDTFTITVVNPPDQ